MRLISHHWLSIIGRGRLARSIALFRFRRFERYLGSENLPVCIEHICDHHATRRGRRHFQAPYQAPASDQRAHDQSLDCPRSFNEMITFRLSFEADARA